MSATVVCDTNTGMDDPSADRILELLAAHDQLPLGTIADELDRHPVTVDRQCYGLQTDGYVRIAGSGSAYVLTDAGMDRVADEADRPDSAQSMSASGPKSSTDSTE